MLGLASGVVVLFGMRQVQDILAPIFLALVLVISVYPLRTWLVKRGAPRWLATLLVIVGVYAILLGLVAAFVIGIARLADLLPQYSDQIQSTLTSFQNWLSGIGVTVDQIKTVMHNISPGTVVGFLGGLLSGVMSLLSLLVFLIVLVLFMGIDSAVFATRATRVGPARRQVLQALGAFAIGTRKYYIVASVFGGIVAVLDWIALLIIGIPAAFLWGVVAFVTNYIPNVGFIIGVIPPAILGLFTGGPSTMIAVIVVYCALNFVIQSVIQPKFVGDSVGLTTTVSFLSLIVWTFILGPLGSILAVPMTLLVKALLVDYDPDARWFQLFLGDQPDLSSRKEKRAQRESAAAAAAHAAADAAAFAAAQAATAAALLDEDEIIEQAFPSPVNELDAGPPPNARKPPPDRSP
jgi:predicted PurR-regulated permease PerM